MMLNIFFFTIFLIGIIQVYILSNMEDYYTKLQNDVIKRIINDNKNLPKKVESSNTSIETLIQYFNLFTLFIVLIGLITPYWYIFGTLFVIISIGNHIHSKYEVNDVTILKGGVNTSLKKLKIITYVTLIIKVISFFGLGIIYFQGLI